MDKRDVLAGGGVVTRDPRWSDSSDARDQRAHEQRQIEKIWQAGDERRARQRAVEEHYHEMRESLLEAATHFGIRATHCEKAGEYDRAEAYREAIYVMKQIRNFLPFRDPEP